MTGVVIVQAGQHLPDNRWNLDISASNPELYRGVVGNLSEVIGTDKFRPLFDQLCEDPRYLGYRISGRYSAGLPPEFLRDLRYTAERGRSVDFLVGKYSLKDVAQIAQEVPDLRIILDHFGNLTLDGKPLDPDWEREFRAAARQPGVHCKVSALFGRWKEQPAPTNLAPYRRVLDLALEAFGEDRIIYGSDWPVTRQTGDYASVLRLTRSYFDPLNPGISRKLFSENARRFYRY